MRATCLLGAALALLPVTAFAAETITYRYDAKGREALDTASVARAAELSSLGA